MILLWSHCNTWHHLYSKHNLSQNNSTNIKKIFNIPTSRCLPRRRPWPPSRPQCRAWWWRWGPPWWTSWAPCWAGTCRARRPPAGPWRCAASTSSWCRRGRRRSCCCEWSRGSLSPGWPCCLPGPNLLCIPGNNNNIVIHQISVLSFIFLTWISLTTQTKVASWPISTVMFFIPSTNLGFIPAPTGNNDNVSAHLVMWAPSPGRMKDIAKIVSRTSERRVGGTNLVMVLKFDVWFSLEKVFKLFVLN